MTLTEQTQRGNPAKGRSGMGDYEYIELAYNKVFHIGDTVCHTETNKCGTVIRPMKSHLHYVRVNFGMDGMGLCHPDALQHVEARK